MIKLKLLLNTILLSVCLLTVGCESYTTSSSHSSDNDTIILAHNIQTVYWGCVNNPDDIEQNKIKWTAMYGADTVARGIELFINEKAKEQ